MYKTRECVPCFERCQCTKTTTTTTVPQIIVEEDITREDVLVCLSRDRQYYRLILTTTEIILQNDNHDWQMERFGVEDVFGCNTMRNWNQTGNNTAAYLCFYLYPKSKRKNILSNIRHRQKLFLVFEIEKRGNSHEQNMHIANSWKHDTINILCSKYPKWHHSTSKMVTVDEDTGNSITTLARNSSDVTDHNEFQNISDLNVSLSSNLKLLRRYLVVVNPKSGQGKTINIFEQEVAPILKESGIDIKLFITQHADHAKSMIMSADLSEIDGIVGIGGDGILYEIVNGLRCRTDSISNNMPIGIIAGGSGNGLARSIADYSGEADDYLINPILTTTLAVARGKIIKVNLVRMAEINIDGKIIYSFLSVGWGLLADIDIESEVLRAFGESRFTIWSLYRLAKLRSYNAKLSYIPVDNYEEDQTNDLPVVVDGDFTCVYSSYQSYIGSDLIFAPSATQNDGTIHLVYLLGDIGRIKATKFLTTINKGSHLDVKGVNYIAVKEFTIERDGGIEGHLTIDGETVSGNRITVKLSPTPLSMFTL